MTQYVSILRSPSCNFDAAPIDVQLHVHIEKWSIARIRYVLIAVLANAVVVVDNAQQHERMHRHQGWGLRSHWRLCSGAPKKYRSGHSRRRSSNSLAICRRKERMAKKASGRRATKVIIIAFQHIVISPSGSSRRGRNLLALLNMYIFIIFATSNIHTTSNILYIVHGTVQDSTCRLIMRGHDSFSRSRQQVFRE